MKIHYHGKLIKYAIALTYVLDVLFVLVYIFFSYGDWAHNERILFCHGKISFLLEKRAEYDILKEQLP